MENSFNKNSKGYCDDDHTGTTRLKTTTQAWKQRKWPNNRAECEANQFVWYEKALSDVLNVDYPECGKTGFARANHLGNAAGDGAGGNANRYREFGRLLIGGPTSTTLSDTTE